MRGIFLAAVAALALCGCGGGGGGGGGGGLHMSMSQTPLKASFFPEQMPVEVKAQARVTGSTSAPVLYVIIADEDGTFAPGSVWFIEAGLDTYEVTLRTASTLAIGVHTGTLQVRICPDMACRSVLASASRPYEITVKPPTVTSFPEQLFSAVLQGDSAQISLSMDKMKEGVPVYVSARDPQGRFSGAVTPVAPEPFADYMARLPLAAGLTAQKLEGTLVLDFCGDPACASPFLSRELPYKLQVLALVPGVTEARSLALDAAQNLYLGTGEQILKVTPAGSVSTVFDRSGSIDYPYTHALAVDAGGGVYFSSLSTRIMKVTSATTASLFKGIDAVDMSFDPAGNLYGATYGGHGSTYKLTPEAEFVMDWGPTFTMQEPIGILANNTVAYVADERGVVRVKAGEASNFVGSVPVQLPYGERVWDLAFGSSGSVLVTTLGGLYRITEAGTTETIIPSGSIIVSRGAERFRPSSIVRTPEGRVYMADNLSDMVVYTQVP